MSATAQKRLNVIIADFYPHSLSVVQLTVASDITWFSQALSKYIMNIICYKLHRGGYRLW